MLQKKVWDITQENIKLRGEIEELKIKATANCSDTSDTQNKSAKGERQQHPLKDFEDYIYNKLAFKMRVNPDEVRFSTLEHACDNTNDYCSTRLSYFKSTFKDLIESILCKESKVFLKILSSFKMSEIIRRLNTKKRYKKEEDKATEKYFNYEWSEAFVSFMSKEGKNLAKAYKSVAHGVRNLVKARNQILNSINNLKSIFDRPEGYLFYSKSDVGNIFTCIEDFSSQNLLTPHNLYNLPVKSPGGSAYNEAELSE
ncbi:unnamed protein product [Moneuplotes crassus]|uniref:Uncharacterized protein n=1 Tax=Euplotes crassus TaxID=5936 RepID=A0AAD1XKQ4_EUPCR|nr:unnamed protein product [Moneuplotes crassus]